MIDAAITEAFGIDGAIKLQRLSSGLINHTYKITDERGEEFLLQRINTQVFREPEKVQDNYIKIQQHLAEKNSFRLPAIVPTSGKELLLKHEGIIWRCFEYIKDTYSPSVSSSADEAWKVANCFGRFSAELSDFDPESLSVILPGFHDLGLRFEQFETAVKSAGETRLKEARSLIDTAFQNRPLVDFYDKIVHDRPHFRLHILHHDCKIANILFKKDTHEIYSPIDLDTTQPGLFFSDLGDMIRSIVPNLSENDTRFDDLVLREDFYTAVRDGYLEAMQAFLSAAELEHIDMSGKIVVYMQALRFLTDYLNNDVYYHTDYPQQNKDRATNQFRLFALLNQYAGSMSNKRYASGNR